MLATAPSTHAPTAVWPGLDVRRLLVLREVSRLGSFAAAAAELRYTASAVSQQIAALEREAGVVLVERGARGTRLTAAGEVLERHAEVVLGQLAAARAELDDLARLRVGVLRLVAFASAWSALVPEAVSRYRDAYPDIGLSFAEADPPEAVAAVRAGTADLALLFEPNAVACNYEGLARTVVCEDPLWAVLPVGHPLAGEERIQLDDLADDLWAAPTRFCAPLVRGACATAGFDPTVVFSSADYGAVHGFVAAGAGVALVPRLALTRNSLVVARPLAGDAPSRRIVAVTAPPGPRPATAEGMLDVLRDAARKRLAVSA